jgi:hypothetical protein
MLFVALSVKGFEGGCCQKDEDLDAYFFGFHSLASAVLNAIFGLMVLLLVHAPSVIFDLIVVCDCACSKSLCWPSYEYCFVYVGICL